MKKIAVALVSFSVVLPALASMQFDAKTWRNLQVLDVRTLRNDISNRVGQLVELRCNFRGKDIHHMKPGWYQSSLWQTDPDAAKGFSDVPVMIAQRDLPAFKSLPAGTASAGEITLFGKVLRDPGARFLFVRLIGRSTVVDASGNVSVTW